MKSNTPLRHIVLLLLVAATHSACTANQVSDKAESSADSGSSSIENQAGDTDTGFDRTNVPELGISLLMPKDYQIKRSGPVIYVRKAGSDNETFSLYAWSFSNTEAIIDDIRIRASSTSDRPSPVYEDGDEPNAPLEAGDSFKNYLIGDISKLKLNGNEVFEATYEMKSIRTGKSTKWYMTYVVYKRSNKKIYALHCDQIEPDSLARKVLLSVKPL